MLREILDIRWDPVTQSYLTNKEIIHGLASIEKIPQALQSVNAAFEVRFVQLLG